MGLNSKLSNIDLSSVHCVMRCKFSPFLINHVVKTVIGNFFFFFPSQGIVSQSYTENSETVCFRHVLELWQKVVKQKQKNVYWI